MKYGRRDTNHAEIRDALRDDGFVVFDTADMGNGYPDLHVSREGVAVLVEVKSPGQWLNKREEKFFAEWQGPAIVAFRTYDVVRFFEEATR